jgi:hypothetical protein
VFDQTWTSNPASAAEKTEEDNVKELPVVLVVLIVFLALGFSSGAQPPQFLYGHDRGLCARPRFFSLPQVPTFATTAPVSP